MRADFYVLAQPAPEARLRLACRVAEKAYLAGQSVVVWHGDRAELERFDALLWTFADTSFVPHEWLGDAGEAPVRLSADEAPAGAVGVLINLATAPQPPPWAGKPSASPRSSMGSLRAARPAARASAPTASSVTSCRRTIWARRRNL